MTSSKKKTPWVFASPVGSVFGRLAYRKGIVKVKSFTLTESAKTKTSVQCVINSEEGQAGTADT